MAKISELPELVEADIAGDEFVPVVKGAQLQRATVTALGKPAALRAEAAAAIAEALVSPNYASDADGLAATADGEFFARDNGNGTVTIVLNDAGVAVEQRQLATFGYSEATYARAADLQLPLAKTGASLREADAGAAADGVTDDSAAFAAAAFLSPHVIIDARHAIKSTRLLSFEHSIEGHGRDGEIVVPADHALTSEILFRINTDATGTSWLDKQFPNLPSPRIANFRVDMIGAVGDGLTAFAFAGTARFENLQVIGAAVGMLQATNTYSDKVVVANCHFANNAVQAANQFLVDLAYFGDGVLIRGNDFRESIQGAQRRLTNGIRLNFKMGASIEGNINGVHEIQNSRAFSFRHHHGENGALRVIDSVGSICDNILWPRINDGTHLDFAVIPFQFKTADAAYRAGAYNFENNILPYWPDFHSGYPVGGFDMLVEPGRIDIEISNCWRWQSSKQAQVASGTTFTALRATTGAAALAAFNRYGHFACERSRISNGKLFLRASTPPLAITAGLRPGATPNFGTWQKAGVAQAKVAVQILVDPVRRIGFNGTQVRTYAVSQGGNSILLDINGPDHPFVAKFFVDYENNGYSESFEVPFKGGSRSIYFNGLEIDARAPTARTPGPVDAINDHLLGAFELAPGDNGSGPYGTATIHALALAAPTTGTFRAGDRIVAPAGSLRFDGTSWLREYGIGFAKNDIADAPLDLTGQQWNGGTINAATPLTAPRIVTLPAPIGGGAPWMVTHSANDGHFVDVQFGGASIGQVFTGQLGIFTPLQGGNGFLAVTV